MGNQTSGIVEEEGVKNELPEKSQEVCSLDAMKEENQTQIQEHETNVLQENAAKADSLDAEAEKSEIESLHLSEEHNGSVNEECEAQTDVKPNEPNVDEGRSNFSNEEQDQLCSMNGEMQNPNPNAKCTTFTNSNCTPQEAAGITSDLQEDQMMLVSHVVEKKEDDSVVADTASVEGLLFETRIDKDCMPEEAVRISSGFQEDQMMLVKEIDDHVVQKKKDDFIVADTAPIEGSLVETRIDKDCTPQEAVCITSDLQADQMMLMKEIDDHVVERKEDVLVVADVASVEGPILEKRVDKDELGRNNDHSEEEKNDSFNALNDPQSTGLQDSSAEENANERLTMNESSIDGNDNTSYVDQPQPSNQEIKQFLISCNEAPQEMIIKCDVKQNGDEYAVEIDHLEKDVARDEVKDPDELTEHAPIQTEDPIAMNENQERKELTGESTLEDSESKAHVSTEKCEFGSNSRYIGVKVELRKSPSFDFGLSFDARSEESDRTPLLYQERTPMRSLSSCSNPRFQSRSVQTECLGKSIQYEAVEVEEKTIRMERSSSGSSMDRPLYLLKKEGKGDVITRIKQENSASDKKQENGVMASPSRDNGDTVSPKANGKRRPKSSLFTTCICCTAAIN